MSEAVIVSLSRAEFQQMLDKAMREGILAATQASGELWSADDVARHYGVSVRTIGNWASSGRLPRRTTGGKWRRCDILEWDASDSAPKRRPKTGPTDRSN